MVHPFTDGYPFSPPRVLRPASSADRDPLDGVDRPSGAQAGVACCSFAINGRLDGHGRDYTALRWPAAMREARSVIVSVNVDCQCLLDSLSSVTGLSGCRRLLADKGLRPHGTVVAV